MEKKQSDLCLEILRRFQTIGLLGNVIIIGSWCAYFYRYYFEDTSYHPSLMTRDIDFLIPQPAKLRTRVDLPEFLKDLGFVTVFKGTQGFIKLDHPELILEFLVPERGKGMDKPYPLPKLGVNATTLRFLSFLSDKTVKVKVEGLAVTLPHPANFGLHKLIISQRRVREDKATKDRRAALDVLKMLIARGRESEIFNLFKSIPRSWQNKIVSCLKDLGDKEVLEVLTK